MSNTLVDDKHIRVKQVLLATEHAVPSAPIFSLGRELNRLGVETPYGNKALWSSTREWMKLALHNRVLVFVLYKDDNPFFTRQIYRARMLGCQVVRWWVGSDVLWCRESEKTIRATKALDQAVDLNIAVSPHLVAELAEIGIDADYVPSPCNLKALESAPPASLPRGVLAYLPANRKAFYGEQVLIDAIEANPDLEFFILSDDSHSLGHYPNVRSLGWVDDMEPVWAKAGLLLRVTEHDGMPRMVLEALARSRYVIYSEHFDGCWYGRAGEEVQAHLTRFKALAVPNTRGPEVAGAISKNAAPLYLEKIEELRPTALSVKRLKDMIGSVRHVHDWKKVVGSRQSLGA